MLHLHLHTFRSQEDKFKYNLKPLGKGKKWLFGTQTRENMFWSLCSALPIWTAYECIMLWCHSNDYMLFPIHNWLDHPIYFCILLFVLIPVIHHIHFYFIHRLIHWPPLYKYVHSLHHKNVQVFNPPKRVLVEREVCKDIRGCEIIENGTCPTCVIEKIWE